MQTTGGMHRQKIQTLRKMARQVVDSPAAEKGQMRKLTDEHRDMNWGTQTYNIAGGISVFSFLNRKFRHVLKGL